MKYSHFARSSWIVPAVSVALLGGALTDALAAQAPLLGRQRRMLEWNGPLPGAVSGRFDADAFPDVVSLANIYGGAPGGLRLFTSNAVGALEASSTFIPHAQNQYQNTLVAADFDLDSNVDVLWLNEAQCFAFSAGCTGGFAELWRGDGTGSFTQVVGALSGASSRRVTSAAVGDMTGDGLPEIVAGTLRHTWQSPFGGPTQAEDGGSVRWIALGGGMFAAPEIAFPDGSQSDTRVVLLADVDVDGDLDLYRSQAGDWIVKNVGGGAMGAPAAFWNGFFDSTAAAVFVDPDQDGDPDLALTSGTSAPNQVLLQRNDGSGVFTVTTSDTPTFGFAQRLARADANHDGIDDLVLVGTLDLGVWVASQGKFVAGAAVPESSSTGTVVVDDFDQDGDDDLLAARYNGSSLHQSGSHGFQQVSSPDTGQAMQTAATVRSDVDGDGDLDVIVSSPNARNAVLANDGVGTFDSVNGGGWTADFTPSGNHNGYALASADLEGDGDDDLVTARKTTQLALSYRNQGGLFTPQSDFASSGGAIAVSLADVDGNGFADALFAIELFPTSAIQLHLNTAGSFTLAAGAVPSTPAALVQTTGDIDGDGDPDFVQALGGFSTHPTVAVRTNQWPAPFVAPALAIPSTTAIASSIALDDVDQDGDLDVLVGMGSQSGPASPVLLSNTPGALVAAATPAANVWTTDVEFADFDADGDRDVLLVNQAGAHKLWASEGGGLFSDVSALTPTNGYMTGTIRAEVGDFDSDADLDVVFAGSGAIDTWFGVRRQLAWSNVPAIGKPLDLELHGAPGSPFVLGVSNATTSIPLPGLGTLRLDPSSLVVLGQGVQDASGEAHRVFSVPLDATLVGVEIYAQAVLGAPLAFGNLERIRFTDL